jgi:superfamily II DNA/RNA helicase
VPAVELHGNLGQQARTRNLLAFSEGSASTLVATDIAARGIHVDDVTLVIHADPPVEHKAYLHRSGRTARAGASGTVVTLMTDAQVTDVRALTRKAGITATTTRLRPGHPLLAELAPGERAFVAPGAKPPVTAAGSGQRHRQGRGARTTSDKAVRTQSRTPKAGGAGNPARAEPAKRTGAAAFSSGSRAGRRTR